ncbi:hypothetical protein FOZ60_001027 [Perkinsus olseni]|uniref:Uncharacterized protein n=1 Tax=Perkinsus olseni TaxID=32597 RepID=A0A7J6MVD4_PEROL|nr:hypothetical protein FOZ60_001027 [Perkinsus olseni]
MKAKIKDGAVLRSPATRGLCIDEVTGLLCKRTLNWKVVNEKLQDEIIEKLHAHGGLPQNIRMLCSHFHFKHMKAKSNRLVTTLVSAVDEVFVTREQIPKCLITDRESGFLRSTWGSL